MPNINISKIRDIYPNYSEGSEISPMILIESMLILQGQEITLADFIAESSKAADALKFELDKKNKEIEYFIEKNCFNLVSNDSIPKEFRKNQDLTAYYIKHCATNTKEYSALIKEKIDIEKKLMEAKSVFKKYDTLSNVVHNAINTAIQLLSYLKHQEKMDNVSGNI